MTDNDNKDPQITAVIQECVEVNMEKLIKLRDDILSEIDGGEECRGRDSQLSDWARTLEEATDQLSAELKQLRAERAGLLEALDNLANCLIKVWDGQQTVIAHILPSHIIGKHLDNAKSKLTDSAQRGEGE